MSCGGDEEGGNGEKMDEKKKKDERGREMRHEKRLALRKVGERGSQRGRASGLLCRCPPCISGRDKRVTQQTNKDKRNKDKQAFANCEMIDSMEKGVENQLCDKLVWDTHSAMNGKGCTIQMHATPMLEPALRNG